LDSSTTIPAEPPQGEASYSLINQAFDTSDVITILVCLGIIIIFLVLSALISSSENAFFSLTQAQIDELAEDESNQKQTIETLLKKPKELLATILIANTFINIVIVLVSSYALSIVFSFFQFPVIGFLLEVVFITFIIVLFGEVMPKIYASQHNTKVVKLMATPMLTLNKILHPLVWVLVRTTSIIDKRITTKGHVLSVDELSHAIDITSERDSPKEEKTILKSIINFGNTDVKQIMRQRPDISAIEISAAFQEVMNKINDWGYSRVPVFKDNLDNIVGILYVKDLLPHIHQPNEFKWQSLVRKTYFVPESKKIDDLLKDFQNKRVHVAMIIDEFGGISGMVTMEDILEEIFGEINDEFDEDETFYSRINDGTYVFEAKILINDLCKHMQISTDSFDDIRNDADTLGGLLLEINGEIPKIGETINYGTFSFNIESVDKRRIKRVKVTKLDANSHH
jgi:gliding motility-associated protein GldE